MFNFFNSRKYGRTLDPYIEAVNEQVLSKAFPVAIGAYDNSDGTIVHSAGVATVTQVSTNDGHYTVAFSEPLAHAAYHVAPSIMLAAALLTDSISIQVVNADVDGFELVVLQTDEADVARYAAGVVSFAVFLSPNAPA